MELVGGAETITAYARARRLDVRARLRLVLDVCAAVAHGHGRGVIHRDLKPGNILVDAEGRPRVIDFGVARALDPEVTARTDEGAVGTLRYMSPEQCEGRAADLDVRTDVYSLGVVLYELLTGTLPYDLASASPLRIPELICTAPPRRPSALAPRLRGDLDTIILTALHKERDRRYAGVGELAEDVRRHLDGRPIEARRDSTAYVIARTLRRHRLVSALAACVVVLLAAGLVTTSVLLSRSRESLAEAQRNAEALRRRNYLHSIALAASAAASDEGRLLADRLAACDEDLRGWEWRHLSALADGSRERLAGHGGAVTALGVSADGAVIASGGVDGTILVRERGREGAPRTLVGHEGIVNGLALLPDGRLVSSGVDGTVRLWPPGGGEEPQVLDAGAGRAGRLAPAPDGRRLAVPHEDGTVRVWSLDDPAAPPLVLSLSSEPVNVVRWRDAETICSGDMLGMVTMRSLDGAEIWSAEHADRVFDVAISPDGALVASGGADHEIAVRDADTGALVCRIDAGRMVPLCLVFESQRTLLAASGVAIVAWDALTGDRLGSRLGHGDVVQALCVAPDGVISADASGALLAGDRPFAAEPSIAAVHEDYVRAVDVAPDGRRFVTGSADGTAVVRAMPSGAPIVVLGPHEGWVDDVAFDRAGRRVHTAAFDGEVRTFDADTGALIVRRRAAADGSRLVRAVAASPVADVVASAGEDGLIRIWPTDGAEPRVEVAGHAGGAYDVAFSPDGALLASAGADPAVRVWRVEREGETLAPLWSARGHEPFAIRVAFSPDGALLASVGEDRTARLWAAADGQPHGTLLGHRAPVQSAAFTRDGRRLLTGGYDNAIIVWDLETGELVLSLLGHDGGVPGLAFGPGDDCLLSASNDRTVRVWRAR